MIFLIEQSNNLIGQLNKFFGVLFCRGSLAEVFPMFFVLHQVLRRKASI